MRLILADDHTLFRRSLRTLLEARGDEVAEAATGDEAIALAGELVPDLVLMDLAMPGMDGFEATRRIAAEVPGARVVVLTGSGDEDKLFEALRAGACGYLPKTLEPERLFEMLDRALAGETAVAPSLAGRALTRIAHDARGGRPDPLELTDREREVLAWMAGGVTGTRQLARRLGISPRTVKFHVGNVLDKLQVGSRAEAVGQALRQGLVEPRTGG